nr:MAG: hypothetical protein DIU78_13500 [Pseudomonadota bacterium]
MAFSDEVLHVDLVTLPNLAGTRPAATQAWKGAATCARQRRAACSLEAPSDVPVRRRRAAGSLGAPQRARSAASSSVLAHRTACS